MGNKWPPDTKFCLATPAQNGMLTTAYVSSLVQLVRVLSDQSITSEYITCSMSDVELARNVLASQALASNASHLLFIDADMSFRADLVLRMLRFGRPFVSAIYPKRELDMKKLLGSITAEDIENKAWDDLISRNLNYVIRADATGDRFEGHQGFVKVAGTGMGICLLERRVLEDLVNTGQVLHLAQGGSRFGFPTNFPVYGFFDRARDSAGTRLSEDYSFCLRWITRCNGEVWACIDELIGHVGSFEFKGVFVKTLSSSL